MDQNNKYVVSACPYLKMESLGQMNGCAFANQVFNPPMPLPPRASIGKRLNGSLAQPEEPPDSSTCRERSFFAINENLKAVQVGNAVQVNCAHFGSVVSSQAAFWKDDCRLVHFSRYHAVLRSWISAREFGPPARALTNGESRGGE